LTEKYKLFNRIYYEIKPAIPRSLQIALRKLIVPLVAKRYPDSWPINEKASTPPAEWKGWPNNKKFALVLTHDVETTKGEGRCLELMKLDKEEGFKSAFYFVPGRGREIATIIPVLKKNGFEVGVHDLFHDGKLFRSRAIFQKSALLINRFLSKWEAVGFRAGAMHHNLDWIHDLNILYDSSTFDADPFEPQPDSIATIFPSMIKNPISGKQYIELPYTLPQDFTLFVLMRKKNIDIWKKKLDWIAAQGGMAMVITHPDYMHFKKNKSAVNEYCADYYVDFLAYVKQKYADLFWHVLPSEIARYVISTDLASRSFFKHNVSWDID
jgi:hypothetical protein